MALHLFIEAAQTNATTGTYKAAKVTYERVPPSIVQDAEFEINCTYQVRHKSHQRNPSVDPFETGDGDSYGTIKLHADG